MAGFGEYIEVEIVNALQDRKAIFALPAEWNWCNVWCAELDFATAKAVGVCENPLTKEKDPNFLASHLPDWEELNSAAQSVTQLPAPMVSET
jgi:UDP-glucose:glycoprotein glucosyltransferase